MNNDLDLSDDDKQDDQAAVVVKLDGKQVVADIDFVPYQLVVLMPSK